MFGIYKVKDNMFKLLKSSMITVFHGSSLSIHKVNILSLSEFWSIIPITKHIIFSTLITQNILIITIYII